MKYFYKSLCCLFLCISFKANIQAQANVTLVTNSTAATNITQGSASNILYVAKMDVTTQAVTVTGVNIPISGTMNATDLTAIYVYYNATTASLAGATLLNGVVPNSAAPHTFPLGFSQAMAAGSSGYYIVTGNVSNTAVNGHTIIINGASGPLVFSYSAAPNLTNNQSNIAGTNTIQAADVTVASISSPGAFLQQASNTNVLYVAKMDVTTQPVTVNSVNIPVSGTMNATDLTAVYVYFNATTPSVSGATLLNGIVPSSGAPTTFVINFSNSMTAGQSGYYIVTANVRNTAVHGHTIIIDGAAAPLIFGFTTAPNITNNQTNIAGTKTIQAADVSVASNASPAASLQQASNTNVLYVAKMEVATQPITVNSVNIPVSGTMNATDLTAIYIYYNATAPTVSGAILLNGIVPSSGAPATFTINFSNTMTGGQSGYYIVTANVRNTAVHGHTIIIDGAAAPLIFGFTTAPNITNNQTNIAGTKTIQAADVSVASNVSPAAFLQQASNTNVLYIAKMDVTNQPVTVNSVNIPVSGTMNATDLTAIYIYYNAAAPTVSGAILLNGIVPSFGAPTTFVINFSNTMTAGQSGYYIVTANVRNTAVDGHTVIINGAAAPLVFGFTTAPNITNNQTNIAGTKTIQAASVIVTTSPVASATITPGSSNNIIYIAKMDVTTQPITVNGVTIPVGGTVTATDLTALYIYYNASAPTLTGASLLNGVVPVSAAPYSIGINFSNPMTAGSSGYYIFTANTSVSAVQGNTVKINGSTGPVVFSFVTAPVVTNNQTDLGGLQTLPVSLLTFTAGMANNTVQLKWSTTAEINNASFDIERSSDGTNFTRIGNLKAAGSTSQVHNYVFADNVPEYGNNYYRLKQVDIDNNFTYSRVVRVRLDISQFSVSNLYPNPVKNMLNWSAYSPADVNVVMQLSDALGRVIINEKIILKKGKNQQQLNVSAFSGGQYYITIVDIEMNSRISRGFTVLH